MNNHLTLITGTPETKAALHRQLENIMGEIIEITSYAADEFLPDVIHEDLIVYSSELIEREAGHIAGESCTTLTAQRAINYQHIDALFHLPEGSKVLCVNDTRQMTEQTIDTLEKIGLNHISYLPYYPGLKKGWEGIKVAVTPGEVPIIPRGIERVVDIGVRLIDITTLIDILDHFQLKEQLGGLISSRYTGKIIDLSKKVVQMNRKTETLNEHLKQVVDGVNDGIMAVDHNGKITVFNPFMEEYTGISSEQAAGKSLSQLFKQHDLLQFLSQPQQEGRFFTINTYNVMVYRYQWEDTNSVIFIFKNTDETISMEKAARKQLTKTGYIAKYHFSDIIGKSPSIEQTKSIAKKLAQSDLPVLIQGESGTGKELFASAIHNHSENKLEPFLAVNFSALPEDLLESELFGYEEGAFTGAKKGGKKGLFEQADGGTIFLDEIGDISLKLQARLLRVIQEKEVRKIGGNKNIPIHVRVIAATNKNLLELIEAGEFREDLYHRLKVLYLQVPSLRKRKDDIPVLVSQFLIENGKREKQISPPLMDRLKSYNWYGNVRELQNTISYLITVSEGGKITSEDLPQSEFFQKGERKGKQQGKLDQRKHEIVLSILLELNNSYKSASRKKISEHSNFLGNPLSEQQVRKIVKELEELGYARVKRGRAGTEITSAGQSYLNELLL
ncbi:sigma 54-interacting transcriptional regulator [Halobacillus sp. Marseille-Q1614]|uniref:sigma 54-interacting transcriptional regulator n=1 Tax=Halobacillus sp. Marseille-Q1614 TaxID=2709134 RepID=UPI00156DDEBA|nr:sigma 54-interacting transcriptional regulator [Halobacillus sp. Marseille-Q1614]